MIGHLLELGEHLVGTLPDKYGSVVQCISESIDKETTGMIIDVDRETGEILGHRNNVKLVDEDMQDYILRRRSARGEMYAAKLNRKGTYIGLSAIGIHISENIREYTQENGAGEKFVLFTINGVPLTLKERENYIKTEETEYSCVVCGAPNATELFYFWTFGTTDKRQPTPFGRATGENIAYCPRCQHFIYAAKAFVENQLTLPLGKGRLLFIPTKYSTEDIEGFVDMLALVGETDYDPEVVEALDIDFAVGYYTYQNSANILHFIVPGVPAPWVLEAAKHLKWKENQEGKKIPPSLYTALKLVNSPQGDQTKRTIQWIRKFISGEKLTLPELIASLKLGNYPKWCPGTEKTEHEWFRRMFESLPFFALPEEVSTMALNLRETDVYFEAHGFTEPVKKGIFLLGVLAQAVARAERSHSKTALALPPVIKGFSLDVKQVRRLLSHVVDRLAKNEKLGWARGLIDMVADYLFREEELEALDTDYITWLFALGYGTRSYTPKEDNDE